MRISFRAISFVAIAIIFVLAGLKLLNKKAYFEIGYFGNSGVLAPTCPPISDAESDELGVHLRALGNNILEEQKYFDTLSLEYYSIENQFHRVNDILKYLKQDTVSKRSKRNPVPLSKPKKQEVCPEKFAGKDLGYGAPYYRLGFARVKCDDFVPIDKLITLLMLVPHEYSKPAMSYVEMMTTIANDYPEVKVILVTEKVLPKETMDKISTLKIKFENQLISETEGNMWATLVDQVETPYVLIAPYVTDFDDDIDLYRLVRVLSYRDDVAVAGGSYRNLTGHWDLGCRQALFDSWTFKYTAGYRRSFNECVVCDYLPGPFAAKTEWLKALKFDANLSEGIIFHDLFWRFKNQNDTTHGDLAVVCADVMFKIDPPNIKDGALVSFAVKHDIKKLVDGDTTVRSCGCRRGLSDANKTICTWPVGIELPFCDLWNLGEVVKFVMESCEKGGIVCEYGAEDIVDAERINSTHAWGKIAEIYFHTKNFTAFDKLRPDFENIGFAFKSNKTGLGSFTISTKHWEIMMRGRGSLDVSQMLTQSQLPTRVHVSGAWLRVPRNPGLFARGHFLARYLRKRTQLGIFS